MDANSDDNVRAVTKTHRPTTARANMEVRTSYNSPRGRGHLP
ncbi:MAG: hypothetical protein U0163_21110 [Gemmatimonadaceae bacterium]